MHLGWILDHASRRRDEASASILDLMASKKEARKGLRGEKVPKKEGERA